jgi:ribosomal protein L37AE/L43A
VDAARASNYAVLWHVGVAPAAWALIAARLRMAAKMLRGNVPVALALALAQGGSGWFHLVLLSARAVWRLLRSKLSDLPDPVLDPAVWIHYWRSCAGGWAAQVKLALRTAAYDTDEALAALDGMPEIALGCASLEDEEGGDESEADELMCGVAGCNKTFTSVRALLGHRAGAHGISKNAEYKKRIRDGRCPVCDRDFEVRLRCLHHVVHCSAACKEAILGGDYPELSAAQLAAADAEDLEHRRRCRAAGRHELHALVPGR